MLEKVSFVCENPDCGQRQSVTNSKSLPYRTVNCCKCGHPNLVFFDTDMTVLPNMKEPCSDQWFMEHCGERQRLSEGKQTLGRMSESHEADKEIFTCADKSVSRVHCRIEVRKLKSGREKVLISDAREKEKIAKMATLVNGMPLMEGDILVLSNGDQVKMGKQTVTFIQENSPI